MKVYLAGPWVDRAAMPELARRLEQDGHSITERWWEHEEPLSFPEESPEYHAAMEDRAVADFIGVIKADAVVVLNSSKSEGKAVEQGVAHAQMKPVVIIGQRTNIFHYLPSTQAVPDIEGALEKLK